MNNPEVTILIPNYKTLQLTQLCLRLIRKYTDPQLAHVIVIDNDSNDESLEYLRTLKWLQLIERKAIPGEAPALGHSRALDLGLSHVTTSFVLSIHTDTLMRNRDWLPFLLNKINQNPKIAGVGSWKLESKPYLKQLLKTCERFWQKSYYHFIKKKDHALEGVAHNHYYLRSHCALYRTDLIRRYHSGFAAGEEVAGKALHRTLVENGHEMIFIPSHELLKYMDHINHATTVLNPALSRKQKSVDKGMRRIAQSLAKFNATAVLQDQTLDY